MTEKTWEDLCEYCKKEIEGSDTNYREEIFYCFNILIHLAEYTYLRIDTGKKEGTGRIYLYIDNGNTAFVNYDLFQKDIPFDDLFEFLKSVKKCLDKEQK